jgi:calcineurin-like phosphoesterase family protein
MSYTSCYTSLSLHIVVKNIINLLDFSIKGDQDDNVKLANLFSVLSPSGCLTNIHYGDFRTQDYHQHANSPHINDCITALLIDASIASNFDSPEYIINTLNESVQDFLLTDIKDNQLLALAGRDEVNFIKGTMIATNSAFIKIQKLLMESKPQEDFKEQLINIKNQQPFFRDYILNLHSRSAHYHCSLLFLDFVLLMLDPKRTDERVQLWASQGFTLANQFNNNLQNTSTSHLLRNLYKKNKECKLHHWYYIALRALTIEHNKCAKGSNTKLNNLLSTYQNYFNVYEGEEVDKDTQWGVNNCERKEVKDFLQEILE